MPTNVVMPQMGESIAEGTIVRWMKQVGDSVDRDEPLFEISTDKVDAEIPAPAAGVLTEIRVKEGETVPVDSVVAIIGQAGDAARHAAAPSAGQAAASPKGDAPAATPGTRRVERQKPALTARTARTAEGGHQDKGREAGQPSPESDREKADLRRRKSSPLVRRIASEHDIDIASLQGSGIGGRVTKEDILSYLDENDGSAHAAAHHDQEAAPAGRTGRRPQPVQRTGEHGDVVPMSPMRKKIAEHMILSRQTSAHVHSVFEVDFTRVSKIREARKAEYARAGAKLTYMAFIARAALDGLRAWPVLNASIQGDNIVYHKDINLGIAVALENGLIVPVIRSADEKNILGLSRAIADLAERARNKQLKPEEVQGGTFTITNPGGFGALFGMPIINQPQVAILGVGTLEKRPVVVEDGIAVRLRGYLTLGYDHRLIDGAVADQFMSRVKQYLENFDEASL